MIVMANVIVVGTSHVSQDSVDKVRNTIRTLKPNLVCIELDEKRYLTLKSGKKLSFTQAMKHGSIFLYIFSVLQDHIGRKAGNKPGSDMLSAAMFAKEKGIPVALVDKDIVDISRDIKKIPRKEKLKLISALIAGVIIPQKGFDIKKVPSDKIIHEAMKEINKISPAFYKALVVDRNYYMTHMIELAIKDKKAKKTLVVVGAGHKKEIAQLLRKNKIKAKIG